MKVTAHVYGPAPHLEIEQPTPGLYRFKELNTYNNPAWWGPPTGEIQLVFQHGDKAVLGQNGVSPAALVAVLLDHLGSEHPAAGPLGSALDTLVGRAPAPPAEDPPPKKAKGAK